MSLDLDRITNPLRVARGSHQPGSQRGCAMNVVSWVNGDEKVTDYPECSARPLAVLVQGVNDALAGFDTYLSPENAAIALDLAFRTVGTGGASLEVMKAWAQELLTADWGVRGHVSATMAGAVTSYIGSVGITSDESLFNAATAVVRDIVNLRHAQVLIDFTSDAIDAWRRLAGLDEPAVHGADAVDQLALVSAQATDEEKAVTIWQAMHTWKMPTSVSWSLAGTFSSGGLITSLKAGSE